MKLLKMCKEKNECTGRRMNVQGEELKCAGRRKNKGERRMKMCREKNEHVQ